VIAGQIDSRVAASVGREARLELRFERRGGRTVVAHAYAEPPYRIGRCFADGDAAYVILVCTGPGLFAGDALRQSVRVGPGARVVLTSQSALQVHPAARGDAPPASVRHEYRVDEGAELHCHWDPVIPFAGASLTHQFRLDISSTSRLYWSDALMSGRTTRGEAWQFNELAYELRLEVDRRLKVLERHRITPRHRAVHRPWVTGGANYAATAIVYDVRATPERVEALHRHLQSLAGTRAGVDLVEPRLMLARLLAADGAPFARARAALREVTLSSIFASPQLVCRK
jgi:urease accessory protein